MEKENHESATVTSKSTISTEEDFVSRYLMPSNGKGCSKEKSCFICVIVGVLT